MTTFYEAAPAEGFEWINTCDDADYKTFWRFDGTKIAATWQPIAVRRVRADHRSPGYPSDFPWLGSHALVMRQKAVDALRDLWEANGELLPLATNDGVTLYVFNCQIIDALDEASSTLDRIPVSGRIMRVRKAAFCRRLLKGVDVFKIKSLRVSPTYVSDRVVQCYKSACLMGLDFETIEQDNPINRQASS